MRTNREIEYEWIKSFQIEPNYQEIHPYLRHRRNTWSPSQTWLVEVADFGANDSSLECHGGSNACNHKLVARGGSSTPEIDSLLLQRPRVPRRPPPVAMASSLAAFHSAAGHVPCPRRQQGAAHRRASSLLRLLHLPPEPLPRRRSRRVAAEVRLATVLRFKNGPFVWEM